MTLNWTHYPQSINRAVNVDDFDAALRIVMDAIDPKNTEDLGGHAGIWFSDCTRDYQADWVIASHPERRAELVDFFNHVQHSRQ